MAINDPRDIPGLLAWYSAEAVTSLADNADLTTWSDLSGAGNHATGKGAGGLPKWRSTAGANGGPAVHFTVTGGGNVQGETGAGYFELPTGLMGTATAGEIAVTIRQDAAVTATALWLNNGVDDGFEGSHYPYGSDIYDCWGLPGSSHRQNFVPTLTLTAWRRYSAYSAPSDWAASLDGTLQKSYAGAPSVAWSSTPLLGATSYSFYNGPQMKFQGWMGAVVIYGRKLTTTERADLDAWLAAHPSGGTATAAPTGPAVTWWDGSAAQAATAKGWWDGSAVQPVTAKGWWDGTTVQPLA